MSANVVTGMFVQQLETATAERDRAVKALRNLFDEQNGAPLETRKSNWEAAMRETRGVLIDLESKCGETVVPKLDTPPEGAA